MELWESLRPFSWDKEIKTIFMRTVRCEFAVFYVLIFALNGATAMVGKTAEALFSTNQGSGTKLLVVFHLPYLCSKKKTISLKNVLIKSSKITFLLCWHLNTCFFIFCVTGMGSLQCMYPGYFGKVINSWESICTVVSAAG